MCICPVEGEAWVERLSYTFRAYGHPNIRATHKSTFEITRDRYVTPRGDCIIAVRSEHSASSLPNYIKEAIKNDGVKIVIILESGGVTEVVNAFGSKGLTLKSVDSIVVRKSEYIDERTIAINADKAAKDISRKLIGKLRDPDGKVKIILTVKA